MKCLCLIAFLAFVITQSYNDIGVEAASSIEAASSNGFVSRRGVQFILNGKPFYANGFNAYWLMYEATDPTTRYKITHALEAATRNGLTIARTWGFRDGGYRALQTNLGTYDEQTFQGLDFAIAEAKRVGIKMIIAFVNNFPDFGGKKQYVEWAKSKGQAITSEDDFYTNALLKQAYMNHVKTVVNRVNTFTKVAYKDEPTIMAWELMNEPECRADVSGKTLTAWIREMASYVKSLDSKHLLSTGSEGFYGHSTPQRMTSLNPVAANIVGSDFIANHNLDTIDFASVHAYPDTWFPKLDDKSLLDYLRRNLIGHIEDAQNVLKKPIILGEFGKPSDAPGYTQAQRDAVFTTAFDIIYASAQKGGAAAGALFWHLISENMDNFKDAYSIVLSERSSTVNIIGQQSRKMNLIGRKRKPSR